MKSVKILGASLIIGLMISFAADVPNKTIQGQEGICKNSPVLDIDPKVNGHVPARAPRTDDTIEKQLNRKTEFLKENPTHEDQAKVELIISCRGKLAKCTLVEKTQNKALDAQILEVFKQLKNWEAATLRSRPANSRVTYDITIKAGKISL